jgi:hypothetical protein
MSNDSKNPRPVNEGKEPKELLPLKEKGKEPKDSLPKKPKK